MEKNDIRYQTYINILKEELVPAFGCTEPIALAYAAAKARQTLGALPDRVLLQVSGSIIKNVKSVIVPNTGHLKGMPAAAAAGIIAGDPDRELEVISRVPEEKIKEIREFLENVRIDVEHIDNGHVFDIIVTEYKGDSSARVRILEHRPGRERRQSPVRKVRRSYAGSQRGKRQQRGYHKSCYLFHAVIPPLSCAQFTPSLYQSCITNMYEPLNFALLRLIYTPPGYSARPRFWVKGNKSRRPASP